MEIKEFAFWSDKEIELLTRYRDKTIEFIYDVLQDGGFDRSKKSIAKKRAKLPKEKTGEERLQMWREYNAAHPEPEEEVFSSPILDKIIGNSKIITGSFTADKITSGTISMKKLKPKTNARTLVVPDCHTSPGQDLSRFTALGKYANTKKPDNIVFMGDFANLDSLSGWDQGKEASHGKLYKEDIKAAKAAILLFLAELDKNYKPRIIFLGGNHDEGRIEKYIENHAQLRGHMDFKEDLDLDSLGFEYINYKKMWEFEGVLFTHAVMTAANTPVSGKNILSTISALTAKSIVVGHHHRFETACFGRHGAEDVQQVLLCGLFSEETERYVDGAIINYSRCIVELTHYKHGRFDVNQTSIERLKAEYI